MSEEKKRRPGIGFLGMILIASGWVCGNVTTAPWLGIIIAAIGAIVLIYAILSGNIKLLG